jgi:hypothetical protein
VIELALSTESRMATIHDMDGLFIIDLRNETKLIATLPAQFSHVKWSERDELFLTEKTKLFKCIS